MKGEKNCKKKKEFIVYNINLFSKHTSTKLKGVVISSILTVYLGMMP